MPETSGPSRRSKARQSIQIIGFGVWLTALAQSGLGDEFGRLVGPPLFDVPRRAEARGQTKLSVRALEALPEALRGERSALVIAATDQGNMAKLLVSTGLRKRGGAGGKDEFTPVLVLDRFETIDAADRVSWKARGRDTILFEGTEFDLDTGQVVPQGFGGDVRLSAGGADGLELSALGANKFYTFDKPLPVAPTSPGHPSSGRAVLPTDFNGRYQLVANGQMSGALELSVDPEGMVSGHFRSDLNGAVYPVTGKVAAELARKVEFTIRFPRHNQIYEGLLWTEAKNAIAGTVQILDHPYGFFALREGAELVSEAVAFDRKPAAGPVRGTTDRIVVLVLDDAADRYLLDGRPMAAAELAIAMAEAAKAQPGLSVVLRVPESAPFARAHRAARLIRDAGAVFIRLAPEAAKDD